MLDTYRDLGAPPIEHHQRQLILVNRIADGLDEIAVSEYFCQRLDWPGGKVTGTFLRRFRAFDFHFGLRRDGFCSSTGSKPPLFRKILLYGRRQKKRTPGEISSQRPGHSPTATTGNIPARSFIQ